MSLNFWFEGVGAFRKVYGQNQRRGCAPNRFAKGSGAVIRKALQTLESIKWVEKCAGGGRMLSKTVGIEVPQFSSLIYCLGQEGS